MALHLPGILTPHTVTCRDKTGEGAYGPVHAAARTIRRCQVDETSRMVRSSTGAEVLSTATVVIRPEHGPVPVGSLVKLPSGREAEVIAAAHYQHPAAPEFYTIHLT